MKKILLIFILLLAGTLTYADKTSDYYEQKPDLSQFYTKEDANDDIDLIDFTQLTFLECQFDVTFNLLDAANRIADSFTRPFRTFFYLDTLHNQIYSEKREALNVLSFNDKTLIFTTSHYNAKDKQTVEHKYEIDRYTGRVFVTGTIRHDYGKIAGFVYKNANLNGNGFCVKNLSGQKF